jgi:FemAB-related protein (PEP-CTERM system-associated)
MSAKIIHCTREDAVKWDTFLETSDRASFYQLFAWKHVNESCFGHKTYYLAAEDDDGFSGVLPLVYIKSRLFGKILCSMPFVNFGGACLETTGTESLLLGEAKRIVHNERIAYLELRNTSPLNEPLPTSKHKISMTLDLAPDPEQIWNSFKSKQRTEIRRAYKNDLNAVSGGEELLDTFYTLLSTSWRSMGTPIYNKKYFQIVLRAFPDKTKIFVVLHKDTPIATAFNGYYNGTVEGMWLGISPEFRRMCPNHVLYWEMIKHACENNYKVFHFGRSSIKSGGEFFKKKWNAKAQQLYWQYYLGTAKDIPQLNVQNPKYKHMIELWKKLPLNITTSLGPAIARNIP